MKNNPAMKMPWKEFKAMMKMCYKESLHLEVMVTNPNVNNEDIMDMARLVEFNCDIMSETTIRFTHNQIRSKT